MSEPKSKVVWDDEQPKVAWDDEQQPEPPAPVPAPTAAARAKTGEGEAFVRGAGQGASFSLSDEMAGAGAWLAGRVHPVERAAARGVDAPLQREQRGRGYRVHPSAGARSPINPEVADYVAARDTERSANRQAAADTAFDKQGMNPVLAAITPDSVYGVGEAAGTLATVAAPVGGAAAKGATLAARAGQAMRTGAALGGLSGFGAGEGDIGDQALSTATGAAMGGVMAPIAAEASRLGARGANAARKYLGGAADRVLTGGPAAREVTYGGPALARKAEHLADPLAGKAARAEATAGNSPDVLKQQSVELGGKVSELWEHGDAIKWHEDIASKKPIVRKAMEKEGIDPRNVTGAADAALVETKAALDDMGGYVEKGTPDRTLINKLQKEVAEYSLKQPGGEDADAARFAQQYHGQAHAPEDYDVAADRFMRLDQVKREFQKALDNASKQRGSAIIDQLRGVEEKLRGNLEDPRVWGQGASALQKVRNRGWRERLLLEGKDAAPDRMFLSDASGQSAMDPYRLKLTGDNAKLEGILKHAGTGTKEEHALRQWADREAGLLEALTHHSEGDSELAQRAARARQLAGEINTHLGQRGDQASAARDMDQIVAAKPPAMAEPPGVIKKAIEGQPVIGPIAKAVGERMRPQPLGDRAQMLAKLEDVLSKNPDNPYARKLLAGMTPQERPVRTGMRGRALNVQPATRGARLAGLQAGATVADRLHAIAQQDPAQLGEDGKLLAQAKDKDDFNVKHAALLATSQQYREKAREMAKQAEQEPQP